MTDTDTLMTVQRAENLLRQALADLPAVNASSIARDGLVQALNHLVVAGCAMAEDQADRAVKELEHAADEALRAPDPDALARRMQSPYGPRN